MNRKAAKSRLKSKSPRPEKNIPSWPMTEDRPKIYIPPPPIPGRTFWSLVPLEE